MFILRIVMITCVVGCAAGGIDRVPDGDYQGTVPARQRAKLDQASERELQIAKAELAGATTALAEANKLLAANAKQSIKPLPATADSWFKDREPLRQAAAVEADKARDTWLRANLAWRQHRVEAATARVRVVEADRELMRAKAIDRNLLGDDTYDSAPYRGQLARAQEPWYRAELAATSTRSQLESLGAKMASTREAYAQITRDVAPEDTTSRLKLSGWSVNVPRRGLKYIAKAPVISRQSPRYLVLRR